MTAVSVVLVVIALLALAAAVVLFVRAQGRVVFAKAEAEQARQQLEKQERRQIEDRTAAGGQIQSLGQRLEQAQSALAAAHATLEQERRAAQEKLTLAVGQREELEAAFKRLSSEALQSNAESFLRQATERFEQAQQQAEKDLAHRHTQAEQVLKPFDVKLTKFQEQITEMERNRSTAFATLDEQLKNMRQHNIDLVGETRQLSQALRAPQQRGKWGELQLRRIVESAGMLERVDFIEQHTSTTDEGTLRPDLVVNLGEGKQIVVDAKVSLSALLEAFNSDDDEVRANRFAAHARHLRQHVDTLAGKRYWERLEISPEFVVMFVPTESAVSLALEQDATLYEYAFDQKVLLCSPASLVALLRTVSYIWRQEALAHNAQQVLNTGRELFNRIGKLAEHVTKLGANLNRTVETYNSTVGSLESRVLVTARKMNELHVADADLPEPTLLDRQARHLQAPELTAADDGVADVPHEKTA